MASYIMNESTEVQNAQRCIAKLPMHKYYSLVPSPLHRYETSYTVYRCLFSSADHYLLLAI